MALLDQFGRPIETARLTVEESAPQMAGVRTIFSNHPSRGLTPQRLANVLLASEQGDAVPYLELAEDMEEKDLHYLSVISTRKLAVSQLPLTIKAASDSARDVEIAQFVREQVAVHDVDGLLFDMLDAVGKGYSVTEIIWETSAKQWVPKRFAWRDPKYFQHDRVDGTTLCLREGAELRPLAPFKYITHVHRAKSGLPIRGGLARAAAWVWLFKNFSLKDWVVFAELYGQPIRVGKYNAGATDGEKALLRQAVSAIGTDAAAIMPQSMLIEFIESKASGNTSVYKDLLRYLDEQLSKAVLGQTATTEVSADGGSRALGDVHNQVRRDIRNADVKQLERSLTRDIVRPLVDLNFGPQSKYPDAQLGLPDDVTVKDRVQALKDLAALGLEVSLQDLRSELGFREPAKDEAVLRQAAPVPAVTAPVDEAPPRMRITARVAAQSATATEPDLVDELVEQALADAGWEPTLAPVVHPVRRLVADATSLEQIRDELAEVVRTMDISELTELLARRGFVARLAASADDEGAAD